MTKSPRTPAVAKNPPGTTRGDHDNSQPLKTCTKCAQAKPLSDYYANRGARDGLAGSCKACILEARRTAYQASPEMRARIKAQGRAWRAAHPRQRNR